jgi:hypothetical protein
MLLSNDTDEGSAAVSPGVADGVHPSQALLIDLCQNIDELTNQVRALQVQVQDQQAEIVTLTTQDTIKDSVCQVNELTQKGVLSRFTETHSSSGPSHDRLHTCTWTIVGLPQQEFTASASTKGQAKKLCAQLYLDAYDLSA